ncbi:hypothetical protein D3C87_2028680 [compost metagenome]
MLQKTGCLILMSHLLVYYENYYFPLFSLETYVLYKIILAISNNNTTGTIIYKGSLSVLNIATMAVSSVNEMHTKLIKMVTNFMRFGPVP